jgi:hypothetical protein
MDEAQDTLKLLSMMGRDDLEPSTRSYQDGPFMGGVLMASGTVSWLSASRSSAKVWIKRLSAAKHAMVAFEKRRYAYDNWTPSHKRSIFRPTEPIMAVVAGNNRLVEPADTDRLVAHTQSSIWYAVMAPKESRNGGYVPRSLHTDLDEAFVFSSSIRGGKVCIASCGPIAYF